MAEFTVEQNDKTPLTSYFGTKIAVSQTRSDNVYGTAAAYTAAAALRRGKSHAVL